MLIKLLALFVGVPLVEMIILIKLGDLLGFWPTIGLVIATGMLGAVLARIQGWRVWVKIQDELQAGRIPTNDVVDGLLIFVAGIVLLTPGLLTDILGFLLLLPPTRAIFKKYLKIKFDQMIRKRQAATVIDLN